MFTLACEQVLHVRVRKCQPIKTLNDKFSLVRKHRSSKAVNDDFSLVKFYRS